MDMGHCRPQPRHTSLDETRVVSELVIPTLFGFSCMEEPKTTLY